MRSRTLALDWLEIEHGFEIVRIDTKTKTIVSVANEEVKMEWVEALTGVMKMGVLRPELDPSATSMSSPQRAARPDKACPNCHQAYGISRAKVRAVVGWLVHIVHHHA